MWVYSTQFAQDEVIKNRHSKASSWGRAPGSWFKFIRMRCYRANVPDGLVLATEG